MSYLVLNRIQAQLLASKKKEEKFKEAKKQEIVVESVKNTPIQPEELRELLMSEINEKISPESTINLQGTEEKVEHRVFSGVENFVEWYLPNKTKFADNQIIPLTTLVQVRDAINVGCGCKRTHRLEQANNYFKTFWEKNKDTDLPATVLRIGNFSSITFSIPLHQNFLIYPNK